MKRLKRIIPLVLLCTMVLTGCGMKHPTTEKVTVQWDHGVISFGGDAVPLTKYTGIEAEYIVDNNQDAIRYSIDECDDLSFATVNTAGITTDNMDNYKGNLCYGEYMSTRVTMFMKADAKNWYYVCQRTTSSTPKEQMLAESYKSLSNIQLTQGEVGVKFGSSFELYSPYYTPTVTPKGALINGVLKVTEEDKPECVELYEVQQGKKTFTLYKYSAGSYDYYTFDGYLITASAGTDISEYIIFH